MGHMLKQCPSLHKRACCYCGKQNSHNRCLCPEKFPDQRAESFVVTDQDHNSDLPGSVDLSSAQNSTQQQQSNTSTATDLTQSLLASGEKVMLQTVIVSIQSLDGKLIKARILLDSASQRTFMTNQLAQKLKLPLLQREAVSTFGAQKATNIDTHVVSFNVQIKDGSYMMLSANVLKHITGVIQRNPLSEKDLEFLKLIPSSELADSIPGALESVAIDLLIGSDFFWDIVGGNKVMLPSGMFILPSKFGYIITGRCPDTRERESGVDSKLCTLFVSTEVSPVVSQLCLQYSVTSPTIVNPQLEDLWCLENIGISDPPFGDSDDEALQKFNETVKFDDGRYQVTWPWKFSYQIINVSP